MESLRKALRKATQESKVEKKSNENIMSKPDNSNTITNKVSSSTSNAKLLRDEVLVSSTESRPNKKKISSNQSSGLARKGFKATSSSTISSASTKGK